MRYTLGCDLGNSYTKTSNKIMFPSLINVGQDILSDENIINVTYNGYDYTVGKGSNLLFNNKYFDDYYKILLLSSIAKSFSNDELIDIDLTIGVPIKIFKQKDFVEKIKKHIENFKEEKIIVDCKNYTIKINSVNIWVEGGILFYDYKNFSKEKLTIIDIGGGTTDIFQIFQGKNIYSETISSGIIELTNNILKLTNEKYKSDLKDGRELLNCILENKSFKINDNSIDLKELDQIIKSYCYKLFSDLQTNKSLNETKLVFIGGGSIVLRKYIDMFKETYDILIPEYPEFVNSITYENISKLNCKKNIKVS